MISAFLLFRLEQVARLTSDDSGLNEQIWVTVSLF